MSAEAYEFRPMAAADLPLIHRWLNEPHVVQWWGEPAAQFDLVSGDLADPAVEQFIVIKDETPFAYLQCYDPEAWAVTWIGAQPQGARCIDQFIGEAEMVGCGHGSAFIRSFIERLLASGVPRVLTDPDPNNSRAIRAYEKAGFHRERLVEAPDGPAILMVRDV
jgi:aminoglycoside 6'-N-acetyltransferase